MSARRLAPLAELEHRRNRLLAELERVDVKRHAAIVAELDAGASLTALARQLGVSRQALTKYLERRETP